MKIWIWRLIPTCFAALVLIGIYLTLQPSGNAPAPAPVAKGLAAFVMHPKPKPLSALSFTDGEGKPLTLADFKGRTVLLNLWATWCAPCRKISRVCRTFWGEPISRSWPSASTAKGPKPPPIS